MINPAERVAEKRERCDFISSRDAGNGVAREERDARDKDRYRGAISRLCRGNRTHARFNSESTGDLSIERRGGILKKSLETRLPRIYETRGIHECGQTRVR
jgi:hypothetical protein